jgi:hypothetical protein
VSTKEHEYSTERLGNKGDVAEKREILNYANGGATAPGVPRLAAMCKSGARKEMEHDVGQMGHSGMRVSLPLQDGVLCRTLSIL